jgi:hypothetical protein
MRGEKGEKAWGEKGKREKGEKGEKRTGQHPSWRFLFLGQGNKIGDVWNLPRCQSRALATIAFPS